MNMEYSSMVDDLIDSHSESSNTFSSREIYTGHFTDSDTAVSQHTHPYVPDAILDNFLPCRHHVCQYYVVYEAQCWPLASSVR